MSPDASETLPYVVAINLTRRCNLACPHCYLDATERGGRDPLELTQDEVCDLLDQIAELSCETMVVLTGGEPLLRSDLTAIVAHAATLGLMTVLGTNATALTRHQVRQLKTAGLAGVGISIDSLVPKKHDDFRGSVGAWEKSMTAIDVCRREGLAFQIHFSVNDDNADELDAMIAFARDAGALALNVFFLVCTGRGETYTKISVETYDRVMAQLVKAAHQEQDFMIRAKCAPHFKRLALELDPDWPITRKQGYELGGCLAGSHYARITPTGEVTPCPYIEQSSGNVRDIAFRSIWTEGAQFQALRRPKLEGRCGLCEYGEVCGGCRARPLAKYGALMGEDFLCTYQPQGGEVIKARAQETSDMQWQGDAEQRLNRVPGFLRNMVRKRAEDYAKSQGRTVVCVEDLSTLMSQRFGDRLPFRRPDHKKAD